MKIKVSNLMDDYIKVMPRITDEDEALIRFDATIIFSDFEQISCDRKSIAVLREKLITYAEQAPNAFANYDAIEHLLYRMDELLG